MSAPQSTIYICSGVRLDNRYEHSIYFKDATAQQEYFAGKVVETFPAYSYLRKTWPLQVSATMEEARKWSYLFFRNGTGKYYYYFITQVEYKNDNMVELTLELDVLQTYLFDITREDCFVERNHVAIDDVGTHTLDEGLEVGELVDNEEQVITGLNNLCILVLATINPNYADTEKPVQALAGKYNGVFSGVKVWAVSSADWAKWGDQIDALSEAGFLDGVIAMWMYPQSLVELGGENTWDDDDLCKTVDGVYDDYNLLHDTISRPAKVNGYTPKNNKLLTYPYSFLYATNNNGGSAVYRWERFSSPSNARFIFRGTSSPEATVKMFPKNYNGLAENYEVGLSLSGFPMCAWDADMYKMWLAQNQNQHQYAMTTAGLTIVGGAITSVASLAMGNVVGAVGGAGAVLSGAQQIGALMAQKADMAIQPPQARGGFSAGVNVTSHRQTFTFIKKTISAENAKAIDEYFTMYGYKLNRVTHPYIHCRERFTYVKTIGCIVHGKLCIEDITKIESIFDKGVTFWVDGDEIGNYTDVNPCIVGEIE